MKSKLCGKKDFGGKKKKYRKDTEKTTNTRNGWWRKETKKEQQRWRRIWENNNKYQNSYVKCKKKWHMCYIILGVDRHVHPRYGRDSSFSMNSSFSWDRCVNADVSSTTWIEILESNCEDSNIKKKSPWALLSQLFAQKCDSCSHICCSTPRTVYLQICIYTKENENSVNAMFYHEI